MILHALPPLCSHRSDTSVEVSLGRVEIAKLCVHVGARVRVCVVGLSHRKKGEAGAANYLQTKPSSDFWFVDFSVFPADRPS